MPNVKVAGIAAKNEVGIKGKPKKGEEWKQLDPNLRRSFKGHKEDILDVCFSPNLRSVVSGSADSTVMVWNFKPSIRPFRFVGHRGAVHSVAITPNNQTIISGSADSTIRVWNNTVEGFSQVIQSHQASVNTVSLS